MPGLNPRNDEFLKQIASLVFAPVSFSTYRNYRKRKDVSGDTHVGVNISLHLEMILRRLGYLIIFRDSIC